jgi:hypothetical protein
VKTNFHADNHNKSSFYRIDKLNIQGCAGGASACLCAFRTFKVKNIDVWEAVQAGSLYI